MPVDFNFRPDAGDLSGLIDHERCSLASHGNLAVHILLFPDAVRLHHFGIDVGEQSKRQIVLLSELRLRLGAVLRNANDYGLFLCERFDFITEVTGFARSARGIGPRVEKQNDLLPRERRERNAGAVIRDERECGRLVSNFKCHATNLQGALPARPSFNNPVTRERQSRKRV